MQIILNKSASSHSVCLSTDTETITSECTLYTPVLFFFRLSVQVTVWITDRCRVLLPAQGMNVPVQGASS